MTIRRNSFQLTFLCSVWLIPEAPVVNTSTAWTLAEAAAGRHAEGDQQGARNHPERHAERAVDELRREADQDEGQQVGEGEGADVQRTKLPAGRDDPVPSTPIALRRSGANAGRPDWLRCALTAAVRKS